MTVNEQKRAFSEAWFRAIAAAAGFGVQPGPTPDDQSVDISIASTLKGIVRSPRLDAQLKCTQADLVDSGSIKFPLPQNNYDELRDPSTAVPKILVIVQVPPDPLDWIVAQPSCLELYRHAWWASLAGSPANSNETSTTVSIPSHQLFTVSSLRDIMGKLALGQSL